MYTSGDMYLRDVVIQPCVHLGGYIPEVRGHTAVCTPRGPVINNIIHILYLIVRDMYYPLVGRLKGKSPINKRYGTFSARQKTSRLS